MATAEEIIYPSIIFQIKDGLYSINSKYVITIMQLTKYEGLPECAPAVMGILPFRGDVISLIDLRTVFGMPSLKQEYYEFAEMLDVRKQDHIDWVNELRRTVEYNEEFTLATNHHECAFGKWYDEYVSKNHAINHLLQRIDEPHRKLHEAAIEIENCRKEQDLEKRKQLQDEVFERLEQQYMTEVLKLLDEVKESFRSTYHEMLLVLKDCNGRQVGVAVDEVLGVEELEVLDEDATFERFSAAQYVCGVQKSTRLSGVILELDGEKILDITEQF